MSRRFFHADWHFNHKMVAGLRGFATPDEHDDWLIGNINSVVKKKDHLWVLGDVFMGNIAAGLEKVGRVNGIKHLVLGNHDNPHPIMGKGAASMRRHMEVFESIHLHEQVRLDGRRVMLSHFPYEGDHMSEDRHQQWRLRDEGRWLIHGHVHGEWALHGRQINAGVDWNTKPLQDGEVAEIIKAMESE